MWTQGRFMKIRIIQLSTWLIESIYVQYRHLSSKSRQPVPCVTYIQWTGICRSVDSAEPFLRCRFQGFLFYWNWNETTGKVVSCWQKLHSALRAMSTACVPAEHGGYLRLLCAWLDSSIVHKLGVKKRWGQRPSSPVFWWVFTGLEKYEAADCRTGPKCR